MSLKKHIFASDISESGEMPLEASPVLFHPQREAIPENEQIPRAQHPPSLPPPQGKVPLPDGKQGANTFPAALLPKSLPEPPPESLGTRGAGGAAEAARHLHVPMALREKWPKTAQTPPPSLIRAGFSSCPAG